MNKQPKQETLKEELILNKERFHETNVLLQGSLQPAAHPWSQAYRARQASCFPFGLESVIFSLSGIRPVDDMAHPSLSPSSYTSTTVCKALL